MDMLPPSVVTTYRDEERNFTFRVVAYRALTQSELLLVLSMWRRQQRRKSLPRNQVITVQSIIGLDE